MSVRAGIIATGTELLSGRVTDTNGPWLAERLGELGVEVSELLCVGDRAEDLEHGLAHLAGEKVDLIVTSGGLGPTADDLTAEVVADFAGTELLLDEEMEATIAGIVGRIAGGSAHSRSESEALAAGTRKQAMLPPRASPVSPAGTAPGFVVEAPAGPTVLVLPGPPRELRAMWPEAVATPPARRVLDRAPRLSTVHLRLFGLTEPALAAALREIGAELDLSRLEIVTCLRRFELEVDIRHGPGGGEACRRLVAELERRHPRELYSSDGTTVDEQVADLLGARRIGLGESCTAGLLAGRLTDRAGASDYVAGGIVAYSDAAKVEVLGVEAELIQQHGAVSPEVARAMADGARQRFGADVGVGITGVAGPGGGTEAKPVGYVCLCVTTASGHVLARDPVLPGDRASIRERSVTVAMHLLRRLLRHT
jgi:nicotinamide-nucleotide amidase